MYRRIGVLCLLCLAGAVGPASTSQKPSVLKNVGIDQKLNVQVPPDLRFRDANGRTVKLGDYFGKRPMILALVYFKCPGLCTMVLNDITRAMNSMRMNCGEDFDILTVSFDPRETPDLAMQKKQRYLRAYRRPNAEAGWHFLTGDAPAIKRLTQTVGFRYAWDAKFQQYAHASGIIILTPDGKTSRYFYGIDYAPNDLELSLAQASQGKSISVTDQVLLYCFHYDPSTGKYSLVVTRVIQVGGVITVVTLVGMMFLLSRFKPKPVPPPAHAGAASAGDRESGHE